jgi:hypothetical protein
MVFPYSVFLVLGAAAPATILICASLSTVMLCCKAVYGCRPSRPVLILEFARLVQQSLGTSALFLSYYVFVKYYQYRPALLLTYDFISANQCHTQLPQGPSLEARSGNLQTRCSR